MDGFNTIPIDKDNSTIPTSNPSVNSTISNQPSSNVEISDETKKPTKTKSSGNTFFLLSILALVGVIGYFFFLVFYRLSMLSQIVNYGEQMQAFSTSIDKTELEDFKATDKILKTINEKLGKHVLNSQILIFVNNNIRNTLQVAEYNVNVKDSEVEVSIAAVAPTLKDFAEQTERLFALKSDGSIKSFSISNLSFENETKRLRFTTRIVFERSKVSAYAAAQASNNTQ